MPSVVWDDWRGGLDLRRSQGMAAGNVLFRLTNCYITTGRAIKKRPGLTLVAQLEDGTVGLAAFGGKLCTFYGDGAEITHANALFNPLRVPHWTSGAAPTSIHYCGNFNGSAYVSAGYATEETRHHFLDDPGAWVASTNYALGDIRRPTTANGFRYEVTTDAGSAAGAEPTWPTTVGGTVVDGGITWTCRTFAVTDTNCPHSNQVQKIGQKIYAADGENIAYCAVSDPRDWTTASDAGFLPTGISAAGSDTVTAVGEYRGKLAALFADSTQIWAVFADPAQNALETNAHNIGTAYDDSQHPFANDLVFLAEAGFRSVSIAVITDSLQENDIGSPIDALRGEIADGDNLMAIYYPRLGQLWQINGSRAYVISYSKSAKITAWSVFDFPFEIDDIAVLDNDLYLRSGNNVYRVDIDATSDDGVAPLCTVETFFDDAKTPGILKQWLGFDCLCVGSPMLSWKFDPRNTALETEAVTISGDTRPAGLQPIEVCSTSIAAVFSHQADEVFEIHHLQAYYEELGPT